MQKDLLPLVTNPKQAASMDKVEEAVRDWDTNIWLFGKAGGVEPPDGQKRITLIRMLPVDVGGYVSMHLLDFQEAQGIHFQVHQNAQQPPSCDSQAGPSRRRARAGRVRSACE